MWSYGRTTGETRSRCQFCCPWYSVPQPWGSVLILGSASVSACRSWFFHLHLGLVRQSVRSLGDDLLSWLESRDDLRLLGGLDSDLHVAGFGYTLGINHHDLRGVTVHIDQRYSRNYQRIVHRFRGYRDASGCAWTQLLLFVLCRYPHFDGRAARVQCRTHQSDGRRDGFKPGNVNGGFVTFAQDLRVRFGNMSLGNDPAGLHDREERNRAGLHLSAL